jgi:hypothetical protein
MAIQKGHAFEPDGVTGPSPEDLPSLEAVASKYDQLVELAGQILQGRMTVRLRCWEDGEVEIRAYHAHGYPDSHVRHKTILRYHSGSGDVVGAVKEVSGETEELLHKETIANLGALGDAARRKNF